mgnify:CR=1 FL=1
MSELLDELIENANTYNRWDFNYCLLHRAANKIIHLTADLAEARDGNGKLIDQLKAEIAAKEEGA